MYKTLFFKPKSIFGFLYKFINNFTQEFDLKTIKRSKHICILENSEMLIRIEPRLAQVIVYDGDNKDGIKKIKKYFYES